MDDSYKKNAKWNFINEVFKVKSSIWTPGKNLFRMKDADKVIEDRQFAFILYISLLYKEYLQEMVRNRGWEKFWIPLTPKYLERKKQLGRYENIWMNTGTLINSLEIIPDYQNDFVIVGIDPRAKYSYLGESISILQVAKFMEYGTEKLPPRPLFRRGRDYISKNISRFKKDFDEVLGDL